MHTITIGGMGGEAVVSIGYACVNFKCLLRDLIAFSCKDFILIDVTCFPNISATSRSLENV